MLGLVNNQHQALCSLNIEGGGGGGQAPAGPSVALPVSSSATRTDGDEGGVKERKHDDSWTKTF
jgi:hypothetical protein